LNAPIFSCYSLFSHSFFKNWCILTLLFYWKNLQLLVTPEHSQTNSLLNLKHYWIYPTWLSLFFFLSLGFELRASHLLGRHSYCLGHSASFFFFVMGIFKIESLTLFALGWLWTAILLSSYDYRHEPWAPCLWLIFN
jgi:hypothetical protein